MLFSIDRPVLRRLATSDGGNRRFSSAQKASSAQSSMKFPVSENDFPDLAPEVPCLFAQAIALKVANVSDKSAPPDRLSDQF